MDPIEAEIVRVKFPETELAITDRVDQAVSLAGSMTDNLLNDAVRPGFVTEKEIFPVRPATLFTVTLEDPLLPGDRISEDGLEVRVKSGVGLT